ncbi:PLP-dependent aminotransferase family protein [uncultured Gemmobacter sp.]|uniref:MocR-like pyridoxine biosynthesis transcription factor PdxR n=1 Tax=uncultured Gemmobacter sp. TaxID=1095917 RepID=UPI000B0F200A
MPLTGQISPDMFFVDRNRREPLQMQLTASITSALLDTRAQPGSRMPSTRALATHLGLSRLTVTLVYQELVAQGYLESLPRSGFAVSQKVPHRRLEAIDQTAVSRVNWAARLPDLTRRRRIVKPLDWRSYPYPFIYGQADPKLFNHTAWRDCARRALGARDFAELADDSLTQDDPVLVDYICRNTLPRRGIRARPEEVLITLGAQNALWIAVGLLALPDRLAVVEDPGFPDFAESLRLHGMPTLFVPTDAEGLNPDDLPPQTGLVLVAPSHSIPVGITMTLERRHALLAAADRHDFLVVEDDYETEMSFLEPPSPSLKSLDASGRVIYLGSFSKSLFPGLRIGYLVGPEPFIRQARALRAMMLRHAPGHMQRVTGYFLALGHYDAHLVRLREVFRRRRETLVSALSQTPLEVVGAARHGGSSLWVAAPETIDSASFAEALRPKGVLIEPGHPFFAAPGGICRHFRLGYSSISEDRIRAGVAHLAETVARLG